MGCAAESFSYRASDESFFNFLVNQGLLGAMRKRDEKKSQMRKAAFLQHKERFFRSEHVV